MIFSYLLHADAFLTHSFKKVLLILLSLVPFNFFTWLLQILIYRCGSLYISVDSTSVSNGQNLTPQISLTLKKVNKYHVSIQILNVI